MDSPAKRLLWFLLFFIFTGIFSFAQDSYVLSGKVVDRSTRQPLPGASIRLVNNPSGTSADAQGKFSLTGIRLQKIAFVVSFVGYESRQIEHDFKKNVASELAIELNPSSTSIGEVRVEGLATGQSKAYIDQLKSINIKNIISSEQIAQFPDINAAEAMQRIPGITIQRDQGEGRYVQLRGTPPELTNFNINGEQIPSPEGNVRYVGMDIISADQIESIEVTKVLTPDMDADGIGGTVNIVTKKAKSEKPEIKSTLAGGYNGLRGTGNANLQFSYGQRYGKFGFNMNSNYYRNHQGSDNLELKYAKGPFFGSQDLGIENYKIQYREVQLRHYDILRERTGLSATLDYQFSPRAFIYLRGMNNSFNDDETRRRKIYECDDALSDVYYLYGGIDYDVRQRKKMQNISSLNFGGELPVKEATLDYELSYSHATEKQPDRLETRFSSPGQFINLKFDKSDPNWPVAILPSARDSVNAFNYGEYKMGELLFEDHLISDKNITGKMNLKIPYAGDNYSGFLKFGMKMRFKDKQRDITAQDFGAYFETSTVYPGTGPKLSLLNMDDGFSETNLLNRGYAIDHVPSPELMRDFFEFYPQHFIWDRTGSKINSYAEDYQAYERIMSGYMMLRHDYKNLMILGGVRYEHTEIDYQGVLVKLRRGKYQSMDTLTDARAHDFLLPQFQLKYSLGNNFNLRSAITYTYSRPNFEDVLPYREEDRNEVRYGNPNLRFPRSMNVDLLAEKFMNNGGVFFGGLFYKNIDDFIFYYKRFAHEGDPKDVGLVEITKAINGIKASIYGAEIQSQFKLTFLPGALRNFGLFMNYTYTFSEAYINKRFPANYTNAVVEFENDDLNLFTSSTEQEVISLPGQAKHTSNLALFYDSKAFYVKLSANYHDSFLNRLGADEDLDEYYAAAWHVDFTANVAITKNIRIFADVINLTNAPLRYYLGTPDYLFKQEYYSWWGRMGLKFSI
jgi:TonB-dependent receptor